MYKLNEHYIFNMNGIGKLITFTGQIIELDEKRIKIKSTHNEELILHQDYIIKSEILNDLSGDAS